MYVPDRSRSGAPAGTSAPASTNTSAGTSASTGTNTSAGTSASAGTSTSAGTSALPSPTVRTVRWDASNDPTRSSGTSVSVMVLATSPVGVQVGPTAVHAGATPPITLSNHGRDDHVFALAIDVPSQLWTTNSEAMRGIPCQGWLVGEIDYHATTCLQEISTQIASTGAVVHLDLSGVTFLDASAIGMLITLRNRLTAAGGGLVLKNVPARVERLFRMVDVSELLLDS